MPNHVTLFAPNDTHVLGNLPFANVTSTDCIDSLDLTNYCSNLCENIDCTRVHYKTMRSKYTRKSDLRLGLELKIAEYPTTVFIESPSATICDLICN